MDRLSVSVETSAFREVVQLLHRHGWATNVWDVSTPEQLSDAIDARPRSISADLGILSPPARSPVTGSRTHAHVPRMKDGIFQDDARLSSPTWG
jgi:hypothetical protein